MNSFLMSQPVLAFHNLIKLTKNISDAVNIVKYRAHPSVIAIKENCTSKYNFDFSFVEKVVILTEIKMLQSNEAIQNTDIPIKSIKENADIFARFVFTSLNKCIKQSVFSWKLKTSKYNTSS